MKSDEFIREIEEDIRHERYAALWRTYGVWIAAAAIAVIVGTAGYVGWHSWQASRAQAEATRLSAAEELLRTGKPADAATALAAIAADGGSVGDVATLQEVLAQDAAGNAPAAVAALERLAASANADPILKGVAVLGLVARQLDTGDPKALIARIEPLAAAGQPWRNNARELLALLQVKAGEKDKALATLALITADGEASGPVRSRAQELSAAIGSSSAGGS